MYSHDGFGYALKRAGALGLDCGLSPAFRFRNKFLCLGRLGGLFYSRRPDVVHRYSFICRSKSLAGHVAAGLQDDEPSSIDDIKFRLKSNDTGGGSFQARRAIVYSIFAGKEISCQTTRVLG